MFSLGCLIYETYTDGKPLFNYEGIQKYKKDTSIVEKKLDNITDQSIKKLIVNLIDLDPEKRWKVDQVLRFWMKTILDTSIFVFLYHFDTALMSPAFNSSDIRIALI